MYFVDRGSDLATLNKSFESMPLEKQEELSKALKRDGLVQKQVTVQGKHGTYTQMKWVRAGDDKPAPKPTKQQAAHQGDKPKKSAAPSKETKAAVSDLRKQHGADKVMAAAKAAGITWKENGNDGINWMRCAMAMAASSDKMQAVNDKLSGKTNDTQNKQSGSKKAAKTLDPESMPSSVNPVHLGDGLTKKIGYSPRRTGVFQTGRDSFIVDNGQSRPSTYTRESFMKEYGVDPLSSRKAVKGTDEDWAAAEAHAAKKKKEADDKQRAIKEKNQRWLKDNVTYSDDLTSKLLNGDVKDVDLPEGTVIMSPSDEEEGTFWVVNHNTEYGPGATKHNGETGEVYDARMGIYWPKGTKVYSPKG